jgi:broad specificity phosphatase PhoE
MTIERVLLIRHGETEWNSSGRWQGFEQPILNEVGRAQARALAEHLRKRPIAAIYTSDLLRALHTAQPLADALGLTPIPNPDWREQHLGVFQGLTREQIQAQYPDEWAAMRAHHLDFVIPNGESRRNLQDRAFRAWSSILANAPGPEVAVVSHGGTIKFLLLKLFDDAPEVMDAHFLNTSITTVERNGSRWHLAEISATPHLKCAAGREMEGA